MKDLLSTEKVNNNVKFSHYVYKENDLRSRKSKLKCSSGRNCIEVSKKNPRRNLGKNVEVFRKKKSGSNIERDP